ncbi:MAG TPA: hypothetical protein VF162_08955 [Streptosporangiaceae bacterium]
MKGGTQTGIALAVGYMLGRKHKLRMAALLATAAASGRLSTLGGAAMKRGVGMGASSGLLGKVTPQLGGIADKVRGELVNAGKAAAMAAVSSRVESFSDSLHQRADSIRGNGKSPGGAEAEDNEDELRDGDEPEDSYEDEADDSYEDEADYEDEPEDEGAPEDEDDREPVRRRGGRSRSPVSRAGR